MKPKFSLSSLLWATALSAVVVAWWLDHRRLDDFRLRYYRVSNGVRAVQHELMRLRGENNELKRQIGEKELGSEPELDDPFAEPFDENKFPASEPLPNEPF